MSAYEPESKLDEQFRKVDESRHVDKRQKWVLFGLFIFTLILAAAVTFLLVQSWQETEQSRQSAANEQVEKQQIAEEVRQAICETDTTAIYDAELCERLQAVATEPIQDTPGPQGPQGPRGPQGEQGPRGFLGIPGLAGPAGPSGNAGTPGVAGGQGPQGVAGLNGIDGAPGLPGAAGMDGTPGTNGLDGAPGSAGAQGEPGPQGPPGADGQPGPQGPPGNDGAPGPAGADSTVPGPAGPPGVNGAQGVSIVDVDCVGEGNDSTWQITLSDGQVLNGGGPCKSNGPPVQVGAP